MIALVGISAGTIAAVIGITSELLSDLRLGICDNFDSKRFCGEFRQWSQIIRVPFFGWFVNLVFYLTFSVN